MQGASALRSGVCSLQMSTGRVLATRQLGRMGTQDERIIWVKPDRGGARAKARGDNLVVGSPLKGEPYPTFL